MHFLEGHRLVAAARAWLVMLLGHFDLNFPLGNLATNVSVCFLALVTSNLLVIFLCDLIKTHLVGWLFTGCFAMAACLVGWLPGCLIGWLGLLSYLDGIV